MRGIIIRCFLIIFSCLGLERLVIRVLGFSFMMIGKLIGRVISFDLFLLCKNKFFYFFIWYLAMF
jgi:hypothetical protein